MEGHGLFRMTKASLVVSNSQLEDDMRALTFSASVCRCRRCLTRLRTSKKRPCFYFEGLTFDRMRCAELALLLVEPLMRNLPIVSYVCHFERALSLVSDVGVRELAV